MEQEEFIRNRITELRQEKGVSEYKMSKALGHNKGYIQNISSGRAFPSWPEFFYILDYLGVSPKDFFDTKLQHPSLVNEIMKTIQNFSEDDLKLILDLAKKIRQD